MLNTTEIIKALSDETRYKMIKLLLSNDYCVRALARKADVSESAVSQHLKILREAGVVKGEKRGYFTHYSVDRDLLKELSEEFEKLSKTPPSDFNCNNEDSKNISCYKREKIQMSKSKCENPHLKPKNGKCSEELVKRCHGKEKDHKCNDKTNKKKDK